MSNVQLFPMGQLPTESGGNSKKRADKLRANWTLKDIPSFEVWCAATCYDTSVADGSGGPMFHQLMYWALTQDLSGGRQEDHIAQYPKEHWKLQKPKKEIANSYPKWTDKGYFIPKLSRGATVAGGAQGFGASDNKRSFESGDRWDQKIPLKDRNPIEWISSTGIPMPWSKVAFYESLGLDLSMPTETNDCHPNSNMARTFTSGAPNEVAVQKSGCASNGNRMAAYYGLYYYWDCQLDENNWSATCKVNGKRFLVRMRAPNPAYFSNEELTKLWIKEKALDGLDVKTLNDDRDGKGQKKFMHPSVKVSLNWDFIVRWSDGREEETTDKEGATVKGKKTPGLRCFRGPWTARPGVNTKATLTWGEEPYLSTNQLYVGMGSAKVSKTIQPRLDRLEITKPSVSKGSAVTTKGVRKMDDLYEFFKGSTFEDRVHKREEYEILGWGWQDQGLCFGWSSPAALYLYPHTKCLDVEIEPGLVKKLPKDHRLYQPWPTWKNKAVAFKKVMTTEWSISQNPAELLEPRPWPVPSEEQKYALGMTDFIPVRDNADLYSIWSNDSAAPTMPKAPLTTAAETGSIPVKPPALQKATPMQVNAVDNPPQNPQGVEDAEEDEGGESMKIFEVDNSNEADSLLNILEIDPPDDGQVRVDGEYDEKIVEDTLVRNQIVTGIMAARFGSNLQPLPPGSARRVKDKDGNVHFFSSAHQPWTRDDIYLPSKHGFSVAETMDADEVQEYEDRYGSASNLLLRSSKPAKLGPPKTTYGEVRMVPIKGGSKRILDLPIDAHRRKEYELNDEWKALFRRNMRRILSIYFDESGSLGTSKKISVANKQLGMLKGLHAAKCRAAEQMHPVQYKGGKGLQELLPPVFTTAPKLSGFVDESNHLWRGTPQDLEKPEFKAYLTKNVDAIQSNMTVLEWLQSPWHYEYLPYQPMNSVFKDNESYCAGCNRCARPFYEYEKLYSAYLHSHWATLHWPNMYWTPETKKVQDCRNAPRPFHDEQFWSTKEVPATGKVQAKALLEDETPTAPDNPGGYHNWPTKAFLFGWEKPMTWTGKWNGERVTGVKGPLVAEFMARVLKFGKPTQGTGRNGVQAVMVDHQLQKPYVFREYLNHMFQESYTYDELMQGMVRSSRAKVQFGMQKYRLMRSVKYGNVCRDCAATLDMAPGLYYRTGRVSAESSLIKDQVRPGMRQLDTWWLGLKDKPMKIGGQQLKDADGNPKLFDPWFLYLMTSGPSAPARGPAKEGPSRAHVKQQLKLSEDPRAGKIVQKRTDFGKDAALEVLWGKGKWEKELEVHLDAVAEFMHVRNCQLRDGSAKRVPITKIHKPPEVYTQKVWDRDSKKWHALEQEAMGEASKLVGAMLEWLTKAYDDVEQKRIAAGAPVTITLPMPGTDANRAFFDALKDTHYLLGHLVNHKREDKVPKFDPDLTRYEWRNWKHTEGGKVYRNSLRIQQVTRPDFKVSARNADGTVVQGPQLNYVQSREGRIATTIFPYDGDKEQTMRTKPTDWRGDAYILKALEKGKVDPLKHGFEIEPGGVRQERHLTQSRFFITYSLHRRVASQLEARAICEKMADAVRFIFGNDEQLCRILLFGMKLQEKGEKGDTVSSRTYVPITEARKEATIFYGGAGGEKLNSYIYDTYQTHVDEVTVDAGIEIGPTLHHPHFHVLVTINHWSYVQIDTFRMNAILEQLFKGTHYSQGDRFLLLDGAGLAFYTDNENPYTNIRLFPTDNWADVISAYVRKGADKESIMALRARTGEGGTGNFPTGTLRDGASGAAGEDGDPAAPGDDADEGDDAE